MGRGAGLTAAVGAGYLLGRRRRLRLALILAGAAASGRLGSVPAKLLGPATQMLGTSAELTRLSRLGAPLATAGRAAAVAALSRRIGSLTERLNEQTEALGALGRRPVAEDRAEHEPGTWQDGRPLEDRDLEAHQIDDGESDGPDFEDRADGGREARPTRPRQTATARRSTAAPVRRRTR